MQYWAYENWRAHGHRTTIHEAICSFCQNGKGLAGGTRPDNGEWHNLGEFERQDEAMAHACTLFPKESISPCGHCCQL